MFFRKKRGIATLMATALVVALPATSWSAGPKGGHSGPKGEHKRTVQVKVPKGADKIKVRRPASGGKHKADVQNNKSRAKKHVMPVSKRKPQPVMKLNKEKPRPRIGSGHAGKAVYNPNAKKSLRGEDRLFPHMAGKKAEAGRNEHRNISPQKDREGLAQKHKRPQQSKKPTQASRLSQNNADVRRSFDANRPVILPKKKVYAPPGYTVDRVRAGRPIYKKEEPSYRKVMARNDRHRYAARGFRPGSPGGQVGATRPRNDRHSWPLRGQGR